MSFTNFIPKLWSARLLANLDNALVANQFVSRDYEGEIKAFGDTVYINQVGDITIKDYDGSDIDDPEELDSTQQTLSIDQAKYFNFMVKDIDKAQSNIGLVDTSMGRAGYAMDTVVDKDIFEVAASGAGVKVGTVATPKEITVRNAYDEIVMLGVTMDENNVPKFGRKLALPAWYFGLLARDFRFTKDMTVLANGVVQGATVGGFQLVSSNNLKTETSGAVHAIAAGGISQSNNGKVLGPIQLAMQVVETEAYRPQNNFSDAVKGLTVWGRKVVQPKEVADFVIVQGTETTPDDGLGA
ncbi:P22 coat protein - protein 5 domain protein [Lactococcus protaetiae]|uniref:P22 coat protein-protein 5 domain protein n=1 Tax=Lactococcus protaetiae TaxID=2592653 RepID=A0A514Z6Y0_9LACT|nr:P22 coat protein - protein 5 domain protein [Lactococcus protaetiae]QDK70340.1 P22 coat protein - protein 5 domain protein [Lactococcus protaetiae]